MGDRGILGRKGRGVVRKTTQELHTSSYRSNKEQTGSTYRRSSYCCWSWCNRSCCWSCNRSYYRSTGYRDPHLWNRCNSRLGIRWGYWSRSGNRSWCGDQEEAKPKKVTFIVPKCCVIIICSGPRHALSHAYLRSHPSAVKNIKLHSVL